MTAQDTFYTAADQFFKEYTSCGRVRYSVIQNESQQLSVLTSLLESYSPSDRNDSLAFFINAYNLIVINQLVQHYPVSSPNEIPGFFTTEKFVVSGNSVTLNQLENKIIRPIFRDPGIHFALVCGALGCPPITNFAYRPLIVNDQLGTQTRIALNDREFIRVVGSDVALSEIFKWYESDFLLKNESIVDFINQFREEPLDPDANYSYYNYDWSINDFTADLDSEFSQELPVASNIFIFTPSRLLQRNQLEVQLFNNLYTQTAYRDGNREKVELDTRDTYYSALFYALFGVSKSAKINAGFDLNLKSVLIDTSQGSPLNVFRFRQTDYSRTAVTSLGPKIKFQPFRNLSNFSIQSAFWFPVAKDLESIDEMSDFPWMDYHMYTWWNQFFFDKTFGSQWQLFSEVDLLFRFKTKNGSIPTHVDIPISLFLSWFPGERTTLYYQIQYSPRIQLKDSYLQDDGQKQEPVVNAFDLVSDYAHTGFGLKYQLTTNFNLEASTTYFFTSMNGGAGSTFNLGIRFIL